MKKYYVLTALLGLLLLPLGAEELLTAETYASYYGEAFNGKPTSSGEIFDMNAYTAAHKTLPFGTLLEVTNLENGKKVVVRVNDRGPFIANREIDLSKAAAESLGMINRGITRVSIKKVESLEHAALIAENDVYNGAAAATEQEKRNGAANVRPEALPSQAVRNQGQDEQVAAEKETTPLADSLKQNTASKTGPVDTQETSGVLWRIQLGAFTREENALRLVVRLRKAGFDPAYERTERAVRVVLPGIRPFELEKVKEALAKNSFTDYVIRQERW